MTSRDFLVRHGTEADLDPIADIRVRTWAQTYGPLMDPAVLKPFLGRGRQREDLDIGFARPDALLLIATSDTYAIGGFALTFLTQVPDPWLESLHVTPELQGSGIGTLLLRATATEIRASGRDTMALGMVAGNTNAGRLYKRLGAVMIRSDPVEWAPGVWLDIYRWGSLSSLV